LSRAEDTVFCGRVFIFLFQSFPLGDKSSVNLRGEFHVENVTTYDTETRKSADAIKPMDIDVAPNGTGSEAGTPAASAVKEETPATAKEGPKLPQDDSPPDLDALYPIFWEMQAYFSSPTRLFQPENLSTFKESLSATLKTFQKVHSNLSASTSRGDENKRGMKRKRSSSGTEFSSNVNTKYLTNRDLFDLEVHDIAFRRHILVQALIILDFLLSLTPAAKAKLSDSVNKAVLYSFTLSDEDATWATSTKSSIASYLQQGNGNEGKFYYRMVDTVLSRDKNWVRWKADSCPSIDRPPVKVEDYIQAQETLKKLCTKHPLPPPPGAAELGFLSKNMTLESLKEQVQFSIPSPRDFYNGIKNDELDAEMGTPDEIKVALDARESKLWRALRASKRRFDLCERIENGKNLEALLDEDLPFHTKVEEDAEENVEAD
jgi:THO complex subunit 1